MHACTQTSKCEHMHSHVHEGRLSFSAARARGYKLTHMFRCDCNSSCAPSFFNPSPRGNIFQSNNRFSTSCWIRRAASNRLELDQKLMLSAVPQQQVLNTKLISVSRGQTSAWCLSQPELPAWGGAAAAALPQNAWKAKQQPELGSQQMYRAGL